MARKTAYTKFMSTCLKGGHGVAGQRNRMRACAAKWRKKAGHKYGHRRRKHG